MAKRFSIDAVFNAVDQITAPIRKMQSAVGKFTRRMERGFKKANRMVDGLIRGFGKAGKAIAGLAVVGIGGLVTSVGLLVREFSKIEDAQAAFTPLLGGAEKARQAVQALNDTAATTPFQFETLAKTANFLLPVMNGNIADTIKTVRMLGDTAGGNAQKLESVTRGFTKAMLKGKTDMESLNMIAEAGVPIFTELADSMGMKVGPAFFKMISAGKVTTKQLTAAFEKMTAKGGIFFNGMEIASKTTSGLFSTLKDNISLTAAELGGVLAPTVKELIILATDAARKVREWVKTNRELIASKFIQFVNRAKVFITEFIERVRELNKETPIIEVMTEAFFKLLGVIKFLATHGKTIGVLTAAVLGLSVVLKIFIGIFTLVNLVMAANPITLIVIGVIAAIAAFAALVIWIDDVAKAFANMNPFIRAILTPLELVIRSIKFIKDAFNGGFGSAFNKLKVSLGFDGNEEANSSAAGSAGSGVISPQDRIARTINEQRTTSSAEVTLKAEKGTSADVTKGKLGDGLKLESTGAF